jgi:hypothetical protein
MKINNLLRSEYMFLKIKLHLLVKDVINLVFSEVKKLIFWKDSHLVLEFDCF